MTNESAQEVELKVHDIPPAIKKDIGVNIARISSHVMKFLNVKEGDPIEIEGLLKTIAIAKWAYPGDAGSSNTIRIDTFTRKRAGTDIGCVVRVRKAQVSPVNTQLKNTK